MNLNNIKIISAPRIGLSSDQVKEILEEYYNGKPASKIEFDWELKPKTIDYFRKKMDLPKYNKFSDELLNQIVNEYTNGKLMKDIEVEYNISHCTVFRFMKKHNIEFRNGHGRKNHFNQDYFENIDCEHKAYWLGFIYADGSVGNTGNGNTKTNRLTINISNKDIELLTAFCDDIGYDKSKIQTYEPIGTYSTNLMSRLSINSIKLCSDLAKLGVHPNKTGTLLTLPNISEQLIPHFLRGYFDGDGWCSDGINKVVGFVGDNPFLVSIENILKKYGLSQKNTNKEYRREFPIYYLRYSSRKDLNMLYKILYKESTICLKRKQIVFESFIY